MHLQGYSLAPRARLRGACCSSAAANPEAAVSAAVWAPEAKPFCFIGGSADRDLRGWVSATPNWTCSSDYSDLAADRVILRIPVMPSAGQTDRPLPRYLVGRNGKFKRITIVAQDADGSLRQREYSNQQVQPGLPDLQFSAALPPVSTQTRFIYVAVDEALQPIFPKHLRLVDELPGNTPHERNLLLFLAVLCGMIIMPLAFNLAFFRILREPFLLWHVVLSFCALTQIVLSAGFHTAITDLTLLQMRTLNVLSFGGMMVAASMFAASFIEPDKLPPRWRKALHYGALWCGFITLIHVGGFASLGRSSSDLFYLGSAIMLPLFTAVLWCAARLGSRAVWFQMAGWAPLFLTGMIRVTTSFLPQLQHSDANGLFHVGVMIECVATALGVVDRFMSIRRQRDRALSEARISEALSGQDHLTGLMNRRAIEPRFAELREMGFDTFALIDIDRFKNINDTHGHSVGDDVLCAIANALEPDRDLMAMRLGGEEFVLLLRGKDATARAERRRMAIPARIAAEVPGLDRLVTASMGLVELPKSAQKDATFNELYVRADRLLYEAKEAGRNRAIFERVISFAERRKGRRPGESVAA